jgi:Zn-dependent protease
MTQEHALIVFNVIVFLFAICVHESAHAWMASRLGDPTARMLGRITLNPIKHIDPIGTVVLPLMALFYHFPMIGWAKPTPVDPRNFRRYVRDDILTSIAGPISNFLIAIASIIVLKVLWVFSQPGSVGGLEELLKASIWINVLLGVFNLVPVPPLDGSHVLRHLLPESARRVYDMVGVFGLILLFVVGGRYVGVVAQIILGLLVSVFKL